MGLLKDKNILITGVLSQASLAFKSAELCLDEGANVILSGAGRGLSLTQRMAKKLTGEPEVVALDVTDAAQAKAAREFVSSKFDHLDGIIHAIGFAPQDCLGQGILKAGWNDVSIAIEISSYSLKLLAELFLELLKKSDSASIVGFDFDATVTWPGYDWMGVAKAAFESLSRYLARDLGPYNIRVNLISAGPIKSLAAKSIPGFSEIKDFWDSKSPLHWDVTDSTPVAKAAVALLSDYFPKTTGEIIHVDAGYHIIGA
jgi:enoyl ACP reductase